MSDRFTGFAKLFGCLPVIVVIASGKDQDTPNGPGEYWSELEECYWRKADNSRGKAVSEAVLERAEKQDYGFYCLIQEVIETNYQAYCEARYGALEIWRG